MSTANKTKIIYSTLPLRDIVMFPGMVAPLFVGRQKSIKAIDNIADNKTIVLVTQIEPNDENPSKDTLFQIGVIAEILQLLKLPDGTVKVLVEAKKRVKIKNFIDDDVSYKAEVEEIEEKVIISDKLDIYVKTMLEIFEEYIKLNKRNGKELLSTISSIKDFSQLTDIIASNLHVKIQDKQSILEILNVNKRIELVCKLIEAEIGLLNTEKRIKSHVKKQMEKTQKDYYLNEQLKAIHKELGDSEDPKSEINELEAKIKKVKLTDEAREKALNELKKLKTMNSLSGGEATIIRNYLDWIITLPWGKYNKLKTDITEAKNILDSDHYGLEKVKERIIEYLAVLQRIKKMKGTILCLVGPPGVGKTSLAKSIADATGREFVRFSLGGVRDEAEIRGHRRTYIGAMPGKIIQSLKKCKTSNPVFLLDEIDKLGNDHRGDPASAMLEVLDPEQNIKFSDHYLEVDYDLSNIMFVATANSLNMPRPLLDRMEIIRLSGYTEDEKTEIAKKHLIEKQKKEHGLKNDELSISDNAIKDLIRYYTRESGVRNLEREIANLSRKTVKEILETKINSIEISSDNLGKYSGIKKFIFDKASEHNLVGVTTGLAYTQVGGEILSIEAVSLPGKGEIKATGKLGEVMQESAKAAFSYFKSESINFGVSQNDYQKKDIHLHVPEGATPKDGPSAGIAIFTTIVSIMTGIAVDRNVAMTGEITLRGRVLAIGGLKEKLLAALRSGIKTVIIPMENVKDLEDIPENVKTGLRIEPVSNAGEVLKIALISYPERLIEDVLAIDKDINSDQISKH